ncbi:MAG: hypothetical protein WCK57_12280 [Verrucomicrobiae bacterium]
MSILSGFLVVVVGIEAFVFASPPDLPTWGLAVAGVGFLKESRGSKRIGVFVLLGAGSLICAVGLLRAFHIF